MKPEAQRIAIAGACGWKNIMGWMVHPDQVQDFHSGKAISYMPDYLSNLNAMHEAEKTLPELDKYFNELSWVVYRDRSTRMFCATAAQRAEAFLRTIRK